MSLDVLSFSICVPLLQIYVFKLPYSCPYILSASESGNLKSSSALHSCRYSDP